MGLKRPAPWFSAELAASRIAGGVHAWSPTAETAGGVFGWAVGMTLSLPCLPGPRQQEDLLARLLGRFGPLRGGRLASLMSSPFQVTVPTEAARSSLLNAWTGISNRAAALAGRVRVLPPPACRIDGQADRRRRARQALGLEDHHCLLVAPDEMLPGAGHKFASWVHAILRELTPHVRLLMPGGGPHEARVRYFSSTTGFDEDVLLTEDRLSLADCLAAGDIALFLREQDCGLTGLVGAMAAGLPIVASRTPDIIEATGEGQAAVLTEIANPRVATAAALRLMEDPALARRFGQAARRRAQDRYSIRLSQTVYAALHGAIYAGPASCARPSPP
jgi:hypothetical protein